VKFGSRLYSEEKLLQKIWWEVRARIVGKGSVEGSAENVALCNNWGISVKVLV